MRYMHSDVDTLERIEIIRDLRLGAFDVLVGINLLREGLGHPGMRAGRHPGRRQGRLSALDKMTDSLTGGAGRRPTGGREKQQAYNAANGIINRLTLSSRTMVNNRNTTPSAAILWTCLESPIRSKTAGPTTTPAAR